MRLYCSFYNLYWISEQQRTYDEPENSENTDSSKHSNKHDKRVDVRAGADEASIEEKFDSNHED